MPPTLTVSGKGLLYLSPTQSHPNADEIRQYLEQYGFVIIKNCPFSISALQNWLSSFGELIRNDKRVEETMLVLDGSKTKEVLRGNGRLPLHNDGLLMNNNVRYIAIYGHDFDLIEGGETLISDSENAWNEVSPESKDTIIRNGIEIKPCDKEYYLKNEEKWYSFKGYNIFKNKTLYFGGLTYSANENASYHLRIKDVSEEISNRILNELETIFHKKEYLYIHQWQAHDLILMDNFRVLHGRNNFIGKRVITQLQIQI